MLQIIIRLTRKKTEKPQSRQLAPLSRFKLSASHTSHKGYSKAKTQWQIKIAKTENVKPRKWKSSYHNLKPKQLSLYEIKRVKTHTFMRMGGQHQYETSRNGLRRCGLDSSGRSDSVRGSCEPSILTSSLSVPHKGLYTVELDPYSSPQYSENIHHRTFWL
jgi:hypothetical protein